MNKEEKNIEKDEMTEKKSAENIEAQENANAANPENNENEESEESELEKAQKKIEELNDKYLRQIAEFDNYRKRVMKEKADMIKYSGEKVITTLLPILDDMERAIQNMEKTEDVASVKEGVQLIIDKFMKLLKQEGLSRIETEGKDFDTDFHEAIAMVPGQPEEMKGKIIDCVTPGYMLNDKVIRHAKVAVAQ
ncbi:MAG: nucleotide exchange factor GrpE [Bacteroides sp. 43_108]|nr:MAG: nucleotide exchange factor GrpE [Bacteroides sp. 43_108]